MGVRRMTVGGVAGAVGQAPAGLWKRLRTARLDVGCSVQEAARQLGMSRWTIYRIERGEREVAPRDAYELLRLYGWGSEQAQEATGYGRPVHETDGSWDPLREVPPGLRLYLDYEAAATSTDQFQRDAMPGLLQTPEYARAWCAMVAPQRAALWQWAAVERQRRFAEHRPRVRMILDEPALHRKVLPEAGWRAQTEHILRFAAEPEVTLQVLPLGRLSPAMDTSFTVFGVPPRGHVVSVYHLDASSSYLDRAPEVAAYRDRFEELARVALGPQESLELIARVRSVFPG